MKQIRRFVIPALFLALPACDLSPPLATRAYQVGETISGRGIVYHLPRSLIRVQSTDKSLDILAPQVRADPDARLVLEGRPRGGSSDDFDFVSANGLLSMAKVDSDDRAPAIVNDALTGVSAALRGEGVEALRVNGVEQGDTTFEFDPFRTNFGVPQGFDVHVEYLDPTLQARLDRGLPRTTGCIGAGRVCGGVETLVKVSITDHLGRRVQHWATVIDPTLSFAARIDRAACVNTTNALTVTGGVITKYDVTKPSELAGCLSIPLNVIQAIIAAPVDALTGRSARLAAEKDLLANRAAVLQQEAAIIQAEAALVAAEASASE